MGADIPSLGYPLVFKARNSATAARLPAVKGDHIAIRCEARALAGMQKEALLYNGSAGTVWRMVCDEGPYLNGTDLAPFPLAFFATGMALSFVNELLRQARAAGVAIDHYRLAQDNFYTMEGSAIRGDMVGGALPTEMSIEVQSDAAESTMRAIAERAIKTSPAQAYMSAQLTNTFCLVHNGKAIETHDVVASPGAAQQDPRHNLRAATPSDDDDVVDDIIVKLRTADTLSGVEGGAGSSLQATQKRTLHVRAICSLGKEGLQEVQVQLLKPLGSTFRFIGDDSERRRAPASLDYLAAGIGFCFMTQVGRYAAIVKLDLTDYSIVQDTVFRIGADSAEAKPVDTHLYLSTGEDDRTAQKILFMSERTCFLHAAMRGSNQSRLALRLNNRVLEGGI